MSASTTPTDRPASAIATAMLAVTVDLPTPPLPLLIAIMRGALAVSACGISISLLVVPGHRGVARAKLGRFVGRQFRRHAGAIGRVSRGAEMTAVPARSERGRVPLRGERGGKPGQRGQEPSALGI